MPAGVRIINDHDTVQIDENYSNLCVVASGTQTSTAPAGMNAYQHSAYANDGRGVAHKWWSFGTPPNTPGASHGLIVRNAAGYICFDSSRKYARVVDVFDAPSTVGPVVTKTYPAGRQYAVVILRRGVMETLRTKMIPPPAQAGMMVWAFTFARFQTQVVGNVVRARWYDEPLDDGDILWSFPPTMVGPPRPEFRDGQVQIAILDVTNY